MRIEKEHRHLEDIDEIRIFNATEKDFYKPTPQEFDIEDNPIQELFNNISDEIHTLIPHENGKDFIIQSLGSFTLDKYNRSQEDVKGRLLSKISPLFFDILQDYLLDVYANHNTKNIRFAYYYQNELKKLSNVKILFDMEKIFIVSNNVDKAAAKYQSMRDGTFDEGKTNILENLSQTGSYYRIDGKYTWSQGIYNIINRAKEESDDYYNIVFDLVIPEDKHIVDKIFNTTNKETTQCEEVIRIMAEGGVLKVLEVNLCSYFDESGIIVRQGWVNDITRNSDYEQSKPVDFLLDGFKSSNKLALLIEPLNKKQYNFSKGFYYLIEKDYDEYDNSIEVLDNVVEKDAVEKIKKLINGETDKIYETLTYHVDGNPQNKKIVDLYIERFIYDDEVHSLGFLTDITEEMGKQEQLIESNELQLILIKELHHRVKNNLQILASFLNLEKRAYRNNPDLIIAHMQTRLSSLALLHEKTYKSTDFKNINLKDYLIDHDIKTRKLVDSPLEIEFETYVDEDINLSIEVITPLLLIIDELTMDAIKHAFPDEATPCKKITKKATRLDNDNALLIIEESGVGIEDSRSIANSMGCEIIKSLTKQLGGNISSTESENGTAYKLVFPIEMRHTIH